MLKGWTTGPTWSSTGSEATCAAVEEACRQLADRIAPLIKQEEGVTAESAWKSAIASIHTDPGMAPASIMLSAYGFFDGKARGGESKGEDPLVTCLLTARPEVVPTRVKIPSSRVC
jgi:Molybdopterin-binding domain of aldehyde dehydrogenase